ncbi:MAG: zinc ABC transporter substrate-binding protein [Dokdonella sp.]
MRIFFRCTVLLCAVALSLPAQAALKVFSCEPEWGALLTEIGGDKLDVDVATDPLQDVHVVEAKPSLIAKMRRADLVVCTGAELEIGWLPQLLRQAGNSKVASGPGSFMAADFVTEVDKPTALDRANGDIHPGGNPHVHLDPNRDLVIAKALGQRLAEINPGNAAFYQQRVSDFSTRWQAAIARWQAKAAPLKGKKVVVHHDAWVYLTNWLGIEKVGSLEPKPGVPPTSAHLASLIATVKAGDTYAIISAAYQDPKSALWLSERTNVPAVTLPYTVGGDAEAKDLFGLFDSTIDKLLAAGKVATN